MIPVCSVTRNAAAPRHSPSGTAGEYRRGNLKGHARPQWTRTERDRDEVPAGQRDCQWPSGSGIQILRRTLGSVAPFKVLCLRLLLAPRARAPWYWTFGGSVALSPTQTSRIRVRSWSKLRFGSSVGLSVPDCCRLAPCPATVALRPLRF